MDHRMAREIKELHEQRPQWEKYCEFAAELPWAGLWPAFSWHMAENMDCENGWFHEYDPDYAITKPDALGKIGLPLTVERESSCAVVFSGKTIRDFDEKELEKMFSGNVFMDVYALMELWKLGHGDWAGVKAGESHGSVWEVLTDHEFNGPFEGFLH